MRTTSLSLTALLLLHAATGRAQQESAAATRPEQNHAIEQQDSVLRWLGARATPIRTVIAESGFDDLQPLRPLLQEARIIGLGEATHGTREFFQFKHRMLEFLVRELGARTFAMEASLAAAEGVIEPWVQGGSGQIDSVLASQRFWTWNTEEVRDLLLWMRRYNQTVKPVERVHFAGIDIQMTDEARRAILEHLQRRAPARAQELRPLLLASVDSLVRGSLAPADSAPAALTRQALARALEGYQSLLLDLQREPVATIETERAVRMARTIVQYLDAYTDRAAPEKRDRYMAENLRRIADELGRSGPIVLWAHNGHIAADSTAGIHHPLGRWLREAYGPSYYAIGITAGKGVFQARQMGITPPPLRAFTFTAQADNSTEHYLERARNAAPAAYFNLRAAQASAAVRNWLSADRAMLTVGSVFNEGMDPQAGRFRLGQAFDALVYMSNTTRARPMPSVVNVAR